MSNQQKYDRGDIRRLNAVSVLNQLRVNGALSRANIASALGLTRATVSNIVAALIEPGLVSETEFTVGGAGRPGLLLKLNPQAGCMVAVEIDLDRISIVMANFGLQELWSQGVSVRGDAGPDEVLALAADLVVSAIQRAASQGLKCFGVCVAWAGLVRRDAGELAYGPTSGWRDVALKTEWEARFELPVSVENEAHAGALGVHHFGAMAERRNLIYLSLGEGLAAGVFVDGVLLRGKQGFAGQVGHTAFVEGGEVCSCGQHGCWVTEVGAAAVRRKLAAAGVALSESGESAVDWLDSVKALAAAEDPRVLQVLEEVGAQLGAGLAQLVQTFNPSLVVLGGRLGGLMQPVQVVIEASLRSAVLPSMAEELKLQINDGEADCLRGGLATVFNAVMTNPPLGRNTPRL
jgi:predicted NBD/HSP70 family sugar kinase